MEIINLGAGNSIFNQFIAEIRDEKVQKDSMRFRRNCERMGEIFAYEISKKMEYENREITTPLGSTIVPLIKEEPVLSTILRAGLPVHQGLLNYFDKADNAFVSAYRKHHKDGSFDIELEYLASPDLTDRIVILSDPMLASGASMVVTYRALLQKGMPKKLHVVVLIASTLGLDYVKRFLPENTTIWVGAIDEELTAQSYIVPGLGDAGDLAFGSKE
ncbi:MAG: uracil phosphoribosyltransferase [Flavobacteriales bacterium]|jgi:uracil phosphoribosyltransferase|nr:uracil phosphoribosyltransferase [Flavobacteriales bacterium]MBV6484159.1 Uracil phosphoribosyltransferase [Flavobacteriales bacterium]MBX2958523.1 uracil phosphoribosyltransferase [Flavobacteriales bacterium]MCL4856270.1 uracil phosphoribosyltransferase [Flavobacteriales bacterium]HRP59428.1 uracil phosphoribosyltransferase [Vicingus sp.]